MCNPLISIYRIFIYPHRISTRQELFFYFAFIFISVVYSNIVDLQCCVNFCYTAK